ncbi:hypothetical protein EDB86DRAFT_2225719 [Lactarius hatsudake]|nr:hypothetical protein EDB86DRAFT_2225719 [Lactarius hatsudake]
MRALVFMSIRWSGARVYPTRGTEGLLIALIPFSNLDRWLTRSSWLEGLDRNLNLFRESAPLHNCYPSFGGIYCPADCKRTPRATPCAPYASPAGYGDPRKASAASVSPPLVSSSRRGVPCTHALGATSTHLVRKLRSSLDGRIKPKPRFFELRKAHRAADLGGAGVQRMWRKELDSDIDDGGV